MRVEITSLYAGLVAILFIVLSVMATSRRRRAGIGLGVGQDRDLEKAVRAQANLAEYAPIALILMMLYELNGGAALVLHACGALFVIARVLHAQGLARTAGSSTGRVFGMLGTWGVILVLALLSVWQYV